MPEAGFHINIVDNSFTRPISVLGKTTSNTKLVSARRDASGLVHKVAASNLTKGLEYTLSDNSVDRYGDVIEASGWNLTNFKSNPIALFNHNAGAPIGRWKNLRVDGNRLVGTLDLANAGTSPRIDEIRSLAEQGILRAVSVGFLSIKEELMDPEDDPWFPEHGIHFLKQELLETSLVSIPANPNAVQMAKSLHVSDATMALVFGENAGQDRLKRRGITSEHADTPPNNRKSKMATPIPLSQQIEAAQAELVASRDLLTELNQADALDLTAIEELHARIDVQERTLAAHKASEQRLMGSTSLTISGDLAAPAVRRPLGLSTREPKPWELIIRSAVVHGCAEFSGKSIDQVLDMRYPGHEATAIVTKADATIGTTTVSGWASELVHTAVEDFIDALRPASIYPGLRDKGIGLTFNNAQGAITLPSLTAGGANGSFVGEGQPIRVGRITTAATTLTPRKMGVIVPFSRELAKYSTPAIEGLVRQAIINDTAATLDSVLLDAVAGDTVRPAGLLNGVAATAVGYGGGDWEAVMGDLAALFAPYDTANAGRNLVLIMNPAQRRKLMMMPGPNNTGFGWADQFLNEFSILSSTSVTAGRLIAVDAADFATATGDTPEFDVSETAVVHMENTTPLEIVSGTPTTADPVRSFWQTGVVGIRMLMDVTWAMRRTGMVQWINGTTW